VVVQEWEALEAEAVASSTDSRMSNWWPWPFKEAAMEPISSLDPEATPSKRKLCRLVGAQLPFNLF